MTVVSRWCDRLLEAGWLLAVPLVAVFVNPFSTRVFEPDKIVLFRSLVLIGVAAWVIRALETGLPAWHDTSAVLNMARRMRQQPILVVAILFAAVCLVATVFSIAPRVSLGGSYQRLQGTYTLLSYVALFFLILSALRRQGQLERLVTVLIVATLPVALYGILQHYDVTLMQFGGRGAPRVSGRVVSTLGNAIFVAAYLAMVIPLTLWRLLQSVRDWVWMRAPGHLLRAAVYGLTLLLQTVCWYFAQSRGPLLGLLAELFVFGLAVALIHRHRRVALLVVGTGALVVLLGVALMISQVPMGPLRQIPVLARFSQISRDPTTQSRLLAWQGVLSAVQDESGRLALGYGPDTMIRVFNRYMPPRLASIEQAVTFDRAHNEVLDFLFMTGLVGLIVYLLLYGLIFYHGLRWLGLVSTRRQGRVLAGLMAGGGLLGVVVPWLPQGNRALFALALPMGMVAGVLLYLVGLAVRNGVAEPASDGGRQATLLAALLAAVIGHFVEVQFGIGIVSTQAYAWLYTALMILLGTNRIVAAESAPQMANPAPRNPARRAVRRPRRRRAVEPTTVTVSIQAVGPLLVLSLTAAFLVGCLSYAFLHGFSLPGARTPTLLLIVATWALSGLVVLAERARESSLTSAFVIDAPVYAVASLAWALPFMLYHRVNAQTLEHLEASFLAFAGWMLLTLIATAAALGIGQSAPRRLLRQDRAILYPAFGLLVLALIWATNLRPVRADIYHKAGTTTMDRGLWDQAIPSFRRAVALAPREDQYYIFLGGSYVEQARIAPDPQTKEAWMEQARQVFERGWALSPTNSDHPRQLGQMYQVWAGMAATPQLREERLRRSLAAYASAVELSPQNAELRIELGYAYLALGRYDEAEAQFQRAVDLHVRQQLGLAYAGLGDVYTARGDLERALEAYREGIKYERQRVLREKIRAVSDNPENVQMRESLALVYTVLGRTDDALKELRAALEIAQGDKRAEVQSLMERLQH